jgi:hypothetical protein
MAQDERAADHKAADSAMRIVVNIAAANANAGNLDQNFVGRRLRNRTALYSDVAHAVHNGSFLLFRPHGFLPLGAENAGEKAWRRARIRAMAGSAAPRFAPGDRAAGKRLLHLIHMHHIA